MSDIRLLALDIDGTILTKEKTLTDRTKTAIESATDAGITVALVTGRPFHGIPDELISLKGLRYVISSNGAVMTDLVQCVCLHIANLDPEPALEITDMLRKLDLVYAVFVDGIGYCELEPFNRHIGMIDNPGLEAYIRKSRRITCDMNRVIGSSKNGVENIWFIAHEQAERDELNREINEKWNVRTVLTGMVDVEIGSPEADKGLSLSKLAEYLSVDKSGIMAIGDNDNDIAMLKAVGIAVAMGNADDEVKRIADIITDDNNSDGAAKVIEQIIYGKFPHGGNKI